MGVRDEIDRIAQAKSDLKTSIENKGVSVDDGALIDTYASYVDKISVESLGGITINGIIESYLVSSDGNVSAGDFVKFVNEIAEDDDSNDSGDMIIVTENQPAQCPIRAFYLSDNKVILFYCISSSKYTLLASFISINNNEISNIETTTIANDSYSGCAVRRMSDNVFIVEYSKYSRNRSYSYFLPVQIVNNTITLGNVSDSLEYGITYFSKVSENMFAFTSGNTNTNNTYGFYKIDNLTVTELDASSTSVKFYRGYQPKILNDRMATELTNDRILCLQSSYYNLAACIIQYDESEDTFTTLVDYVILDSSSYSAYYLTLLPLGDDRILIVHYSNESYIAASIYTIDEDNNFTLDVSASIFSQSSYNRDLLKDVFQITDTKFLVLYASDTTNYYLRAKVFEIDKTKNEITVGEETSLSATSYSGYLASAAILESDTTNDEYTIFISHSKTTAYYLYGLIIKVSGTNITIEGSEYIKKVAKYSSVTDTIAGVANTSGESGTYVDIYRPNV